MPRSAKTRPDGAVRRSVEARVHPRGAVRREAVAELALITAAAAANVVVGARARVSRAEHDVVARRDGRLDLGERVLLVSSEARPLARAACTTAIASEDDLGRGLDRDRARGAPARLLDDDAAVILRRAIEAGVVVDGTAPAPRRAVGADHATAVALRRERDRIVDALDRRERGLRTPE